MVLTNYDSIFCPYDILQIAPEQYISKLELKHIYKSLAKRVHPDKGGSAKTFDILQWAYRAVYRDMRNKWKIDEPIIARSYGEGSETKSSNTLPKFKLDEFNKNFGQYKISNEFDVETAADVTIINAPKIKVRDNFNQEFEQHHINNSSTSKVVVRNEPMAMNEIYEAERMVLGRDKINDFTTSKSTDYRKAYTVYNTIYSNVIKVPKSDQVNFSKKLNDRVFSAASVNYKQHTTTPAEIIKQRDGQDFTLNDSDRKRLEYAKTLQN